MIGSVQIKSLIGFFVLVVVASLVYFVMQSGSKQSGEGNQTTVEGQAREKFREADRVSNEDVFKEDKPGRVVESGDTLAADEVDVAAWVISMDPPERPVHEIVSRYRGVKNHDNRLRAELIKGLTYCENRRSIGEIVGGHRSKGDVSAAAELMDEYHGYLKYCSGLDPSSIRLREVVVGELADGGDMQAKSLYFQIGPMGRWPGENEYIPMSKQDIDAWNNKAIRYLNETLRAGDYRSLKTLASMYAAPRDLILGGLHNESMAYAYESLWIASVLADPQSSKEAKDGIAKYRTILEGRVSAETRRDGLNKAEEIYININK